MSHWSMAVLLALAGAAEAPQTSPAGAATIILDEASLWRVFIVRGSELVRLESGGLTHAAELLSSQQKSKLDLKKVDAPRVTAAPPDDWASPDFDDSQWLRARGRLDGPYRPWALLQLRGRFEVQDLAAVGDLTLALGFHGGVAVYLNGRELTRMALPAGPLDPNTPAEDYPKQAFVGDDGLLAVGAGTEVAKRRLREATVKVPVSALHKGVNVLAIEVHRAPAPEIMWTGRINPRYHRSKAWWRRLAVEKISLVAADARGITPNTGRPADFLAREHDVLDPVGVADYGDPCEPLRPVRIVGARNGAFAGMVLSSAGQGLHGLSVACSDLTGPRQATIPASAIQVRYALPTTPRRQSETPRFDGLETEFPQKGSGGSGATQPIWLTVEVPRKASPGDYRGTVRLGVSNGAAAEVPIDLHVANWTLPDPTQFTAHAGLIQSPDSLAIRYGLKMWSDEHWKCIERSFALMRLVGGKEVYIPVVRRTHLGNEHGMVRWIKGKAGPWEHDFSIAERYLDLAVKHLGRVPVVCLYVWEPANATGHFPSGTGEGVRCRDMPIRFTVLDPRTGTLEAAEGPKWGTPECREFWKPFFDAMRRLLEKRGIAGSMMLGLSGDFYPTKTAAEDLAAASAGAKWVVHSHTYWEKVHGQPVGCLASVWGILGPRDPAEPKDYYGNVRFHGWRNPFVLHLPRGGNYLGYLKSMCPAQVHVVAETALVSGGRVNAKPPGVRGIGRVGADFWDVLAVGQGDRGSRTVAGRYPETGWGQLTLNFSEPAVLTAGKAGPISNVRFELMRESFQEAEARVFIEKALTDPAARARLGDQHAARIEAMLDERVRDILRADWEWFAASGWRERTKSLYTAAATVAAALGQDNP